LRERSVRHEPEPAPEGSGGDLPPEPSREDLADLERRVALNPRDPGALSALAEGYRRAGKLTAAWEAIQAVLEENPADAAAQRAAAELGREIAAAGGGEEAPDASPIAGLVLMGDDAYEIRPAEAPPSAREGGESAAGEILAEGAPAPAGETSGGAGEPPPPRAEAEGAKPHAGREEIAEPPAVRTVTLAEVYWAQGERETANRIVEEILRRDPGNARALAWRAARREDPLEVALRRFLRAAGKEYGHELS
jgi:tetratricopeptide (TPR) repeat protein